MGTLNVNFFIRLFYIGVIEYRVIEEVDCSYLIKSM